MIHKAHQLIHILRRCKQSKIMTLHAGFPCALEILKIIAKITYKFDKGEIPGVELTMKVGNRNQGVGILGDNRLMILYTTFVMGVSLRLKG